MNETSEQKGYVEIRPTTSSGVLICLGACAVAVVAAFLLTQHPQQRPRRLWSPVVVTTNGSATTILGESRQLEFWTPSAETKDYLHNVAASQKWEVISNDEVVLQFGAMLHTNRNVLGYRRIKVLGQGRTDFKAGWWWTVNVMTNYSAADLARTYEDFWKSHQPLFVEVIDSRGREE